MIVDDHSVNGIILNSVALVPGQPYPLNDGVRIELGREHKVVFTVEISGTPW